MALENDVEQDRFHDVYDEIKGERRRQDGEWGGPEHDDEHGPYDWLHFIQKQRDRAFEANSDYRQRMVKIAALAVAAVESYDRVLARREALGVHSAAGG